MQIDFLFQFVLCVRAQYAVSFPCAFALLKRKCRIHFTLATHSLCCACRSLFTRTAGAPIYAKITIEDNWLLSYCMLAQKCGRHGELSKKGEFDSPSNKWCLDRSQKNEKKTKNNRRRRHGTHKRDEN